jgi:hypothetical protein
VRSRRRIWIAAAVLAAPCGPAHAAEPARDGLRALDAYERRTQLEDLSRDARRAAERAGVRATGDPGAPVRTQMRWRREDALRDLARARDLEAIERRVEAAPAARPGEAVAPAARSEFERRLQDVERREQLDRLRRDTR